MQALKWVARYHQKAWEGPLQLVKFLQRDLPRCAEHQFHLVSHSWLDVFNGFWVFPDGSAIFMNVPRPCDLLSYSPIALEADCCPRGQKGLKNGPRNVVQKARSHAR